MIVTNTMIMTMITMTIMIMRVTVMTIMMMILIMIMIGIMSTQNHALLHDDGIPEQALPRAVGIGECLSLDVLAPQLPHDFLHSLGL